MAGNNFLVIVEGINTVQEMAERTADVEFNIVRSLNTTARDARTEGQRRIMSQVSFSASYLNPAAKRFFVSKQATRNSLEARITARGRPTSLARFATSNPGLNKEGVSVQVQPGKTKFLKRAFLIKLRAGASPIETRFNMGLAVRLKDGNTLRNKRFVSKIRSGLYVLYGPSVSQVFIDNAGDGVAKDMTPDVLEKMQEEFLRLMEL